MAKKRALGVLFGIAASFAGFVGVIFLLSARQIVSPAVATLMLVALFGMYVGFGILVAVYRLIIRLEGASGQTPAPPTSRAPNDV